MSLGLIDLLKAKNVLLKDEDPAEKDELILDGLKIRTLAPDQWKELEAFPNLEALALNNTCLTSLEGIIRVENLKFLELTDNKLDDNKIKVIPELFPKLEALSLSGNRIHDVNSIIEVVKQIPTLEEVDAELNPFSMSRGDEEKSRRALFAALPQLRVVDGMDRDGNAVSSDDEEEEEGEEENEEPVEGLVNDTDEIDSKTHKSQGPSVIKYSVLEGKKPPTLLQEFYSKSYKEEDDEEDEEEFVPDSGDEESEDSSQAEEDETEETEDVASVKRDRDDADTTGNEKKRRLSE